MTLCPFRLFMFITALLLESGDYLLLESGDKLLGDQNG